MAEYAVYRGDEFINLGTSKELAKELNIEMKSFYYLMSKQYRKRMKENWLVAFRIEEEE